MLDNPVTVGKLLHVISHDFRRIRSVLHDPVFERHPGLHFELEGGRLLRVEGGGREHHADQCQCMLHR